jgi:integrase
MGPNIPAAHALTEGVPHAGKRGRPRKMVGRKREATSMGRFPLLTAARRYLRRRVGILAESTIEEQERKYRYLDGVFRKLKAEGKVLSSDPKRISREDVQAFLVWMIDKRLDPGYRSKLIGLLDKVTTFSGNPVVQRMRAEGERLPTAVPKDLMSLDEAELMEIKHAAERIDGWTGKVAILLTALLPATGLRPSELRLADLDDLDTKGWSLQVRHPKGEDRYAKRREVIILPQAREATLSFLDARSKYLKENGLQEALPLIPSVRNGQASYYSSNWFRVVKAKIEKEAGVRFKLKDFRPTFTQMCLDRDPTLLSDVSKQLGHSTTRTTEKHYGRIRDRAAFLRLEKAFSEPQHAGFAEKEKPDAKKPGIEIGNGITGYA